MLGESVEGQTKSYDSPYKEKLDKSRLGVVRSGQNPIRMQGISHIFDVVCTWLKSLLKNEEEPPVLEEIWLFQGSRDMDEARRSICGLEPLVSTTNFGLVPKWVQAHVGKSLSPYLVNRSLFNSDMGSLRGEVECLDAQRVREADFFEFKVQSDCCLDGRCQASSQVEIMAPTMLNAETLDLDSMLWGGPGVFKCPEKARDDGHEECRLL